MEFKDAIEKLDLEIKKIEQVIKDGLTKQEKGLEGSAQTISQVKDAMTKAEEKLLALETEKKEMEKRLSELEVKGKQPGYGTEKPVMATAGQRFVLSEAYQDFREKKSGKIDFAHEIGSFEKKQIPGALRGDLTADRAPVWAEQVPELIYEPGQRVIRLFDLLASSPTTSNSIEYFKEVIDTSFDIPGSQDHETHEKPQVSFNFEKEVAIVETIAAWLPASRQVLADAPQLQSYIDGRLRWAVQAEAEAQLLFGSGQNGQILGIMNTPGVQTLNPTSGQTAIDCIRLAIAMVSQMNYEATAIVLNPMDWANIELLKGNDLHYIWVQVPNGGEMRLWRVPVISTNVMTEGQYLLGAFGLGAKVWDRQQATVRISEHHEDYFVRNAVAILAELRLALTVFRPSAFVKGVISGSVSS